MTGALAAPLAETPGGDFRRPRRATYAFAALAYAIVTTAIVTPIARTWGADYETYLQVLTPGRLAEVFLLVKTGGVLGIVANGQSLAFYGIFALLESVGIPTTTSLALVSGTSALVIAYFAIANMRSKIFALFLFAPFLLDLLFFQVRNGFALAIFMLAIQARERHRKTSYLLFGLSVVIHASLALFLVAYFGALFTLRVRATSRDLATTVALSKLAAILVAGLFVGSSFFIHQYYARAGLLDESSFSGLMFFASLVVVYIVAGQSFIRRYRFEFLLSVILLWLYPVFAQALRVFASSYPFHVSALSNSRQSALAFAVLLGLLAFNIYQWTPLIAYLGW